MTTNGASRYREMQVMTATPAQRVVMLYGHLLLKLKLARQAIASGQRTAHVEPLQKAHAIFEELLYSLDHGQGNGELAGALAPLYECLMEHTLALCAQPDLATLDRITGMVSDLHAAWAQAAEQAAPALVSAAS